MKITAVRHGQTDGNISHIVQSRTGGKLTDLGIEQAKATAEKLKDEKFDVIYCSSLARCRETLSYIGVYHKSVPVVVSDKLVELDKGEIEGKRWDNLPEYFYSESHIDVRMPNGESWVDLDRRIKEFLNSIYNPKTEAVLIVTHDGPLKAIHSILNNIPLGEAIQVGYDNGGVYELDMLTKISIESVK